RRPRDLGMRVVDFPLQQASVARPEQSVRARPERERGERLRAVAALCQRAPGGRVVQPDRAVRVRGGKTLAAMLRGDGRYRAVAAAERAHVLQAILVGGVADREPLEDSPAIRADQERNAAGEERERRQAFAWIGEAQALVDDVVVPAAPEHRRLAALRREADPLLRRVEQDVHGELVAADAHRELAAAGAGDLGLAGQKRGPELDVGEHDAAVLEHADEACAVAIEPARHRGHGATARLYDDRVLTERVSAVRPE